MLSVAERWRTWRLLRNRFTPAMLFAGGKVGAWYDPSDLSTLFQDTAGVTPVTATGQSVARVNDKSGNGINVTQATAGSRPTYQVDGSGHPYLLFDGVDDVLLSATTPFGASVAEATAMAAAQEVSRVASILFQLSALSSGDTVGRWWSHCPYSDGNIYFDVGGAAAPNRVQAAAPFATGTSFVGTFENSVANSSQSFTINGTGGASDATGHTVTTAGPLALCGSNGGGNTANMRVYGFIARVGAVMSSAEKANALKWLGAKAGLSL